MILFCYTFVLQYYDFFWFTVVSKSELVNILFIPSLSFNLVPAQNQIKMWNVNESSTFKIFENHLSKNALKKAFLVNVLFD